MSISGVSDETWSRLSNGEELTDKEEKAVFKYIAHSDYMNQKTTQNLVKVLRDTSAHFKDKSWQEMCQCVNDIKNFKFYSADNSFYNAVKSEWKSARINAQANRIENRLRREQQATDKAMQQHIQQQDAQRRNADAMAHIPKPPAHQELPRFVQPANRTMWG